MMDPALKHQIEWLVARVHVGVSDTDLLAEWTKRIEHSNSKKHTDKIDKAMAKKILAYVLKCHRKNQKLHRFVMSGGVA